MLDQFKFTVEAQKEQTERNEAEFPDPEPISVELHDRINNRICLQPSSIENHHRQKGIQDI